MKTNLKSIAGNNLLLFFLIFICATVFYLFKVGFSDLWSDEIYTKAMLTGSLSDFFGKFKNDLHPPLYYLGLRLFTDVFGLSPFTLRIFSVLGVLSTLLLTYFAGKRMLGEKGALIFCLMIISIPMMATYSHQARMYTWAAFSITGVFIYSCLFLSSSNKKDLMLLTIFSVIAMYIHYYSMVAAIMANAFVFLYLLFTKSKKWRWHLLSVLITALLYLPWLFMFIVQYNRVQHAFWAPEVSFNSFLACLIIPFTEQFWTSPFSNSYVIVNYGIVIFTIIRSFTKSFAPYRLMLWLSVAVFMGTLIAVAIISIFSQPILYSRYVMTIVTMLAIPSTLLFISIKIKWLKYLLISVILLMGIKISISTYYFSYGPYKQTIDYISHKYPDVKKILHITEVTAGPLVDYNGTSGLKHYWLKAKMSNVDAFPEIEQYNQPDEFLKPGEVFGTVRFHNLELNIENLNRVLSESELLKTDTIWDNKVEYGIMIQLYLLIYKGR